MGMLSILSYVNLIIFFIIPIILIYVAFKYFKRAENRADEKLELERQNTINLQNRVDELNTRVITIEEMLKEVD